tara:strand:+ start:2126 stop:2449 length:324 start_codon:yes stop_codon:yes gene_type:complete
MLISNIKVPTRCVTCGNLIGFSYTLNSTAKQTLCTCPKLVSPSLTLAWECPRCKKINAPWNKSCDCIPMSQPSYPLINYVVAKSFPTDSNASVSDISYHLNKNFTDK